MNKIFKVIWSKTRNCYVVVSELAKSHDDGHVRRSRSGCCRKAAVLAAFVLTTSLLAAPDRAQAATATNSGNPAANQAVNIENKNNTTAQGSDAYATYDSQGNLIVGKDNQVSPIQKDPKTGNARSDKQAENVALGTRNGVGKFTHSTETKKPISGDESYAYQKLDTEWITVKVYNPDTNAYDDKQVEVYRLTPGQYMDDEYNVRAKYPQRSYYSTDEDYRKAVEVYNNVATYYSQDRTRQSYYTSGATAVGVDNVAEGDRSTAIGNKAKVLNSVSSYYVDAYGKLTTNQENARYWLDEQGNISSSRQGYYASDGTFVDRYYMVPRLIDSTDAVAVGSDVTAEGRSAVAIGHESYAKEYSVAIGENSVTDYMGVAIGKDNKAKYASTAIGHTNDANGYYTATLGVNNTARADRSTAIGYGNSVDGQQQNGGTTPKATYTHVLGSNNTVKGSYNAVFGDTNTVTGAYALALGGHNTISGANTNDGDGEYGIAIGYGNTVEKNALALGLNSNSIHDGSIAIGKSVNTTGDNNNGATNSIAIGTKATVHMKNGIVLGNEAYAGNNGDNSEGAIAIGHQAKSAAGESIAIGTKATTGNNVGSTVMTNIGAIAIGSNTNADTVYDIAMGWGANTKNTANGGAIALGHNATIEQGGQASTAIGDSARVKENLHDAVALGSQAYADRKANNQGGYDPASNSTNHNAGSDPVWNSTLAAVSVGSSKNDVWDGSKNVHYDQQTRQITNVAAGKEDTDAVNVAQLKQVVNLVNNSGGGSGTGGSGVHDYSVKSVNTGTDTNYNNGGASGDNALAAGVSASATGENAVAIGTGAEAEGKGATVIGQYASATGDYATAFGGEQTDTTAAAANNMASGKNAVAFGERTTASGANATAFGLETTASEKRATAFGQRTTAKQSNATAFGQDTLADGQNATAFGNLTVASNYGATAFGNKNKATGQYATAWGGGDKVIGKDTNGKDIKQGTVASGTYATAFGERTEASGESATAFGSDSTASGKNSLAFGENSTAAGENSVAALGGTTAQNAANAAAIGKNAQAKLADSVALGSGAVADRQRGAKGYDAATGQETTQTSATWVSSANAVAVGNGSTLTRQITGVAAGSDDTDAVNLAQLKEVGNLAGKHTTVSVGGQKATADDTLVKGGNLELNRKTTDGQANYDVALSKDVVLGEQEEHKGGSLVVNSVAQFRKAPGSKETYPVREAVKIDGTTVSVVKNDGTNDQRQVVLGVGQDTGGYVALFEKTGKTPTYIFNAISSGITYLKDSQTYPADQANEFNRLEYGDITNGSTQFIATLDDGLKFSGDQGTTSAVKLNQKLTVTGGETNLDNLATANNIGVVSSQDRDNGKLELKLNKDLTGLNTVTAGTAKIGHYADGVLPTVQNGQPTISYAKAGDYVTGLTNKDWTVNNPTYVSGRAATEDELRIVSDAVSGNTTKITNNTNQITNNTNTIAKGLSFTTNTKDDSNISENYKGYKVVKRNLGDTIAIKASDETSGHDYSTANLTTRIAENGNISILMDEKPTFTTVTTGDVIYTGNPDKKDNNGKAAQADTNVHYGDKTLTDGKNITTSDNETKATRLRYDDAQGLHHDIATMDDGQIYAGDIKEDGTVDSTGFARTLNQHTTINGGVTNKDNLTDNNIGVVSNGTDTLTVKLAKDLKNLTSVTTGKTVMNDSGIKITNDAADETKNVVINGDKISYGGNQVTNMGSGASKITEDDKGNKTYEYNTLSNGANIGDVKNIAGSTTEAAKLTGDSNITVNYNDAAAGGKNTVKLNDSITLGSDADKKVTIDGTEGTITAGDKVSLDGRTGKGTIGGVTIGNQIGVATTKKDGDKAKTEDGTFVTGLTNTTWNPDSNGIVSGRAATEDQLKTVSDTVNAGWELDVNGKKQKAVTPTSPKVNFVQGQNITITGSGDDVTVATADSVRFDTVRVTSDKNASGGYTGGIVIGKQSGNNPDGTVSDNPGPGYYITGLENKDWDSTKIQHGRAATEDQLQQVAEDIKQGTVTGDKYITGGTATYTDNGSGSAALSGTNGLAGTISGLHDYYIKEGTVSDDGKTLTLTKNDDSKVTVNLDKVMKSDMRLVQNPARTDGKYIVDSNGNLNLTVQDANGTEATRQTITLSGLASKAEIDRGLDFAANSGTAYKAKLGDTVTIKGTAVKDGHNYSDENVTTEVDANGNITIKLDKALTADTVMVNGKDGKDGQIGLNGKDGKNGTVTTIIRTIGKNGTDGKNGTAGVNGTDGITRIVYQDGKDGEPGTTTHTVATLDDGLKFGANAPAAGKTDNPVGNKLNSTISITGAGKKNLDQYSGKNLITSVEQDTDGNTTINVLMDKNISADGVTVGHAGKDGVAGADGEIGKAGTIGINGKDGKDGITTTLIRTEKGQPGKDGIKGKPGVDGTDITRIVYQNSQNSQDGTDGKDTHTVATLDDGLKFAGDDGQKDTTKVISKKLNEQLDIIGGAALDSLTDNNIGVKYNNGKLYVRLAQHVDLNKDGTLKAGDLTIGAFSNTVLTTNKNNHSSAGSYAVGLSNKEWSVAAPEYVSGRAATEDQLKVVSDAIHNRQLVNTDYQLVANPDPTTDGSYTAADGELTLTVRDTEHKDSPTYPDKTITIKDIASKRKVDEAYDRTVKYDMKDGKVDKTHVTFEAKDADNNPVDTQVSHMASGASEITDDGNGNKTYTYNADNNAANIGDVKRLAAEADLHYSGDTGTGTSPLKEAVAFNGTEGQIVTTAENGKVTFKLADDLMTQTITVTGKDGISVKGKDGKDGVTITGKDGVDGVNGAEGHIGLNGKDGMVDIWTKPGKPGVDGETMTRIVYKNPDGQEHQGATLDDGLKFHGDSGDVVTRKLNTQLDVLGGQTDTAKLTATTDGNIGVVSTKAANEQSNGKMEIRLAKELKGLTSVQTGDTTVEGNGLTINKAGNGGKDSITINKTTVSIAGNQITNMGSGIDGTKYTDAGDNNGANIGDVKKLADSRKTTVKSTDGSVKVTNRSTDSNHFDYDLSVDTTKVAGAVDLKYKGDNNTQGSNKLSEAVTFSGTDNQIVTEATNGKVTFKLADDLTTQTITAAGKNGNDGQIGLTGKDGADGKVTTIIKTVGAKGTDGKDGIPGVDGQPGKDGITRLVYDETDDKGGTEHHVVATLDDGLKFVGNDGKVVARKLNDTLSIKGGIDDPEVLADKSRVSRRNLGVRQNTAGDGLEIVMTNRPDFEAITVGPDSNPAHKITIGQQNNKDGNPNPTKGNYITGLDNTQWDAGNVVADRAATEGQLKTVSDKVDSGRVFQGDDGQNVTVGMGDTLKIQGGAKDVSSDNNIGIVKGADDTLNVRLAKDLTGLTSVTTGNTTINNGGLTIKTGDSSRTITVQDGNVNMGGNKIEGVAPGKVSQDSTDAVNGSQLNMVKTLAGQHTTVEAGSKNITVTEGTNSTGGKKYTVDLAKDVTFGDTAKGDKTVAISGTDGTITAGTGDNKVTVDGSKGQIVAGGNNGVKIGNIENGDSSLTIYDKDGKATGKTDKAGKYVTNLDNKTWKNDGSYVSGRAATEDQLHQVESNVNKKFDDVNTKIKSVDKHHTEVTVNGGTAAKADGSYTDGNLQIAQKTGSDDQKIYDLKLSDNLNIGGAGKDGKDGQNGHMGINGADGKSGIGIDGKDGISIKGKDGKDGVTIKGIDGKNGTEGHIGLTGSAGKDGQNASADIHVKNGQVGVDGTDGHGGKDGMDRVVYEDHNHVTHEVATMDDGMKYSGDSGKAAVKLNKNVQIYGGATEYADGNNIGVVASQDGDNAKLQVKLAKDLKGISSIEAKTITTGDTTMDNSGLTVKGDGNHKDITIHQGNVNMGGNKVSGVADGKVSQDSTDAVNGSQLWQRDQAINGLSGSVNKLGNRINRVGAGAAALAALHPLDFDPDDKWDFAAGYGNYRGANAAAVGAYYRPNEDTMFSVGGSFGGGENMVNAGVSIKLGQGNHVSTSRVAMAKEMKAMRQHMAEQDALIAKLQSMHGMAVDPAKSTLFPDVAENHWAYKYVTTLAKKGILEGYPDGEFKGDRMMTRYEFAAIVYRIVESGVGSTDPELSKLVKEFSPELQYIRIDTIQKDHNGKPTIERVRVISDAK